MDNKRKAKLFEILITVVSVIVFLFYGFKSCRGTTKPLSADNDYIDDYEVEVPYKTLLEWVTADCERMNYIQENHNKDIEDWESVDRRWRRYNHELNYDLYQRSQHIKTLIKIDSIEKTDYATSFIKKELALKKAVDCFNEK